LISWRDGTPENRHVDSAATAQAQRAAVAQLLATVNASLVEADRVHRERFMDRPLAPLLDNTGYAIEKISVGARALAGERDPAELAMAKGGIQAALSAMDSLVVALEER